VTGAADPYSRIYWRCRDDPKFERVYSDDRAFATWTRLLIAADMAWPASACLYDGCHRSSVKLLSDVGLIDLATGGRYRIHGLDAERGRRSAQGKAAIESRWRGGIPLPPGEQYDPDTDASGADRGGNTDGIRPYPNSSTEGIPSQDEPRRVETKTSRDEARDARAPIFTLVELVETLTDRPFGYQPGSRVWEALEADCRALGCQRVSDAYRAVKAAANGTPLDAAGVVYGGHKALYPIPAGSRSSAKPKGYQPDMEEVNRAFED
jgi:hypothetical protein